MIKWDEIGSVIHVPTHPFPQSHLCISSLCMSSPIVTLPILDMGPSEAKGKKDYIASFWFTSYPLAPVPFGHSLVSVSRRNQHDINNLRKRNEVNG